jgi:Spy/CpxP family protein refolding chaperone
MRSSSSLVNSHLASLRLFVTVIVPSVSLLACSSTSKVSAQTTESPAILIAQNDNMDVPPELRRRVRGQAQSAQNDGSQPSFGGRPFRRPHLASDQDGNDQPTRMPPMGATPAGGGINLEEVRTPSGLRPFDVQRVFDGQRPGGVGNGVRPGGGTGPGFNQNPKVREYMRERYSGRISGGGIFGKRPLDFSTLNLSDEQKQRIQQIRGQNSTRARDMQKNVKAQRDIMKDMMFDPNANDDQIRAKRKEVRQMQDKLEEMQFNDFLAIRKVFTPEQKKLFADLKPQDRKVAGGPEELGGPPAGMRKRDNGDDAAQTAPLR